MDSTTLMVALALGLTMAIFTFLRFGRSLDRSERRRLERRRQQWLRLWYDVRDDDPDAK